MDQGNAGILAGPWIGESTSPPRRSRVPLLVALLGAALGLGISLLANAWIAGAPAEPAVVARERPGSELPPEWRWSPSSVKYEHMFRKGAEVAARSMFRTR